MKDYLPKLLAYFVALQYKLHVIRTDAKGTGFLYLNPFFGDVYSFFGDYAIGWIKERAKILGLDTESNLGKLLELAKIQQLDGCPSCVDALPIILKDLMFMESFLQLGIDQSGASNDLVTQNTLIALNDKLGVLRRKIQNELGR